MSAVAAEPAKTADNRTFAIAVAVMLVVVAAAAWWWTARMRRLESADLVAIVAQAVVTASAYGEAFDPPVDDDRELARLLVERHHFRPPAGRLVGGRLLDAWGHPLAVHVDAQGMRIASAGPDGDPATGADNLVVERRFVRTPGATDPAAR